MATDKKNLVGVDDPAIVKQYGGMKVFVFRMNGACQNQISVGPIGDPSASFAVDGGFVYRPIEENHVVFEEDFGNDAPVRTPLYGKDLIGSVCHHINQNSEFYLGDREVKDLSARDKQIIWLRAADAQLFAQFHTPDQKTKQAPIPADAKWGRNDALVGPFSLYFPWDLESRHIFDALRLPTYTNIATEKFTQDIRGDSGKFLYNVACNIFQNSSSKVGITPYRTISVISKITYAFGHGLAHAKNGGPPGGYNYGYDPGYGIPATGNMQKPAFAPQFDQWDSMLWHMKAYEVIERRVKEMLEERKNPPVVSDDLPIDDVQAVFDSIDPEETKRLERNAKRRAAYHARKAEAHYA